MTIAVCIFNYFTQVQHSTKQFSTKNTFCNSFCKGGGRAVRDFRPSPQAAKCSKLQAAKLSCNSLKEHSHEKTHYVPNGALVMHHWCISCEQAVHTCALIRFQKFWLFPDVVMHRVNTTVHTMQIFKLNALSSEKNSTCWIIFHYSTRRVWSVHTMQLHCSHDADLLHANCMQKSLMHDWFSLLNTLRMVLFTRCKSAVHTMQIFMQNFCMKMLNIFFKTLRVE